MTKDEFLKLIEHDSVEVHELTKNEAYIVEVEVGDMPKESVYQFLNALAEKFTSFGLQDTIFVPTCHGAGKFTFFRVKDRKVLEAE